MLNERYIHMVVVEIDGDFITTFFTNYKLCQDFINDAKKEDAFVSYTSVSTIYAVGVKRLPIYFK